MTNQLQSFSNCPHLGLYGDSSSVYMMATPSHCCFAGEKTFSPDLEYQTQYCLTPNHTLCSLCQATPNPAPEFAPEAQNNASYAPQTISLDGEQPGWEQSTWEPSEWEPSAEVEQKWEQPDWEQPEEDQPQQETSTFPPETTLTEQYTNSSYDNSSLDSGNVDTLEPETPSARIPDFVEAPASMDFSAGDSYSHSSGAASQTDSSWVSYQPTASSALASPAQPLEMPQQKERIMVWPLALGALALIALMGVYFYSQNGIPAFWPLGNSDIAEAVSPDESAPTNGISEVNNELNGQGDLEQESNNEGTEALTVFEAELEATETSAAVLGLDDSENPSVGILVVTATKPATPTPAETPIASAATVEVSTASDVASIDTSLEEALQQTALQADQNSESPEQNAAEQATSDQNASDETSSDQNVEEQDSAVQESPNVNTPVESAPVQNASAQANIESNPTPQNGGRIVSIKPSLDNAGWWSSEDLERNHLGDSFLYAGLFEGREYISAIRYDLRELARGADIYDATIQLTGLRDDRFDRGVGAAWRVELISEKEFSGFSRANFLTARSAVAAYQIEPTVGPDDLAVGETLTWTLTDEMRNWLRQQIIDGARSVIVRIQADVYGGETLFAWDTGQGTQTQDEAPWLVLSVGRAPETPPPVSTRPFIVATSTPVPKNILTAVAVNQEATSIAQTVGTYTPIPYDIFTPTAFPENLATVQAAAIDRGLPPIVLPTMPFASEDERVAAAQYATAVALTTGTFTPVPTSYVTPQLILPSPIPLNVATTVAREAAAEAQALVQTPTPLPYNAVIAEYVIATEQPENAATEEARRVIAVAMAQTTGTATPLPWHIVVVSPTPTPLPTLPPTITPTPFLFDANNFQPTPEPQPPGEEEIPDTVPSELRGKVIFKSDRVRGQVETLAFDPRSGQTLVVNLPWVHGVARNVLSRSPDGQRGATVSNINDVATIRIVRYENGGATTLSGIEVPGYDVAWSPSGGLIAYVSNATGSDEIYVMNEDGSGQRPLTNTPSHEVKHPTWWNGQIIFHSNQTGRRQLWVMNADGSNARVLMPSDANDFEPVYVP